MQNQSGLQCVDSFVFSAAIGRHMIEVIFSLKITIQNTNKYRTYKIIKRPLYPCLMFSLNNRVKLYCTEFTIAILNIDTELTNQIFSNSP